MKGVPRRGEGNVGALLQAIPLGAAGGVEREFEIGQKSSKVICPANALGLDLARPIFWRVDGIGFWQSAILLAFLPC